MSSQDCAWKSPRKENLKHIMVSKSVLLSYVILREREPSVLGIGEVIKCRSPWRWVGEYWLPPPHHHFFPVAKNLPTTFILKTDLSVMQKLPVPAWRHLPIAQQPLALPHMPGATLQIISSGRASSTQEGWWQSLPFPWKGERLALH